jgi:Zn-dependent protease with chaperone function
MGTDFFTSQDRARRQTGRLVLFFAFGVGATIVSLWAVIALALSASQGPRAWANPLLMVGVIVVVGGIVTVVTLFKLAQLSQGGSKIAEMLGGQRVDPMTSDPGERQLLNIVEEMSIASGVPIPPVYLLEDHSVNAFAAGPDPSRSVIGVTRGCVEHLSRDELQGVIAHEYSHIFHGDTRINARTTAVIAGIMAVGVLGYVMFRFVGPTILRTSGRGKNNPAPAIGAGICMLGLAVWAVGSLGMLFGRMIQAAISRQREFLADAAAVQYTRNPDGIAGALDKIRSQYSSRIESPAASELNHFFFSTSLNTLFATHPPIDERIKRLVAMGAVRTGAAIATARPVAVEAPRTTTRAAQERAPSRAAAVIGLAGTLAPESIGRARDWSAGLPAELREAARRAGGARAICYLIARRDEGRDDADRIVARSDAEALSSYESLRPQLARMPAEQQLALADLCAPALSALGRQGYARFRAILGEIIRTDGTVDLREWALAKSLERHVERRFVQGSTPAYGRLSAMEAQARTVLAIIALTEHDDSGREAAYESGCATIGLRALRIPDASTLNLDALNVAVGRLVQLRFEERERFLQACAASAAPNGVETNEFLVVRAVADALDVPIPALV